MISNIKGVLLGLIIDHDLIGLIRLVFENFIIIERLSILVVVAKLNLIHSITRRPRHVPAQNLIDRVSDLSQGTFIGRFACRTGRGIILFLFSGHHTAPDDRFIRIV
jgi:hypothetical protein